MCAWMGIMLYSIMRFCMDQTSEAKFFRSFLSMNHVKSHESLPTWAHSYRCNRSAGLAYLIRIKRADMAESWT